MPHSSESIPPAQGGYEIDMKKPPRPAHLQVGPGAIVQGYEFTDMKTGEKLHSYDYRVTDLTTKSGGRVLEIINTKRAGERVLVSQAELIRVPKSPPTHLPPSRASSKKGPPPPPSGRVARSNGPNSI